MSRIYINDDWKFTSEYSDEFLKQEKKDIVTVRLPHTCKELPFHYFSEDEYQMVCGYQKILYAPKQWQGKKVFLTIDGAAHYAEVFLNGVASLVAHLAGAHENADLADNASIAPERTDNVRIYNDDVRPLLNVLPDASLDKIFVLFPDPWPKKRHASRRFIGPTNIPKLARLLKEGGELRVASDDMNYIRWSLEHLCASPYFTWTAKSSQDWKNPPADWVNTRYEMKAYAAGRKPVYLIFKRTNQSATCP